MPAPARRRRVGSDCGFTLVELLVVIIIIGLLSAIAVPVYLHQRRKAALAVLKSDAKALAAAFDTWGVDNPGQAYPDVWWNWGVQSNTTAGLTWQPSPDTRTHAFDITSYYPGKGYRAGQAYCIEMANNAAARRVDYHSGHGGFLPSGVVCATSPNAPS